MAGRRVQTLNDDLKNVEFETSEEVEVTPTFDGLGLREDLLRGIYAYGIKMLILRVNNGVWSHDQNWAEAERRCNVTHGERVSVVGLLNN